MSTACSVTRPSAAAAVILLAVLAPPGCVGEEAGTVDAEGWGASEARRRLGLLDCDDGAVEYLTGSKRDETVIPYDEHCLQKYTDKGYKTALPNTVGVHMTGLPKTGTTWTEVFVNKLLESICASGIYVGCKHDQTYRGSMITIPSGHHHAGKVIRFNTFLKHDPPYDWTCKGFEMTRASSPTGCHMYKFQDTEHNIPDWEQCIFRTSYANIRTCIPEYMRVEEDLPAMDKIADEMNFKKKTEVDMNGAQRKYIHVIRDPRDAALSWVHYHGTTEPDVVDQTVLKTCNHYIAWTAFYYYWQMEAYGAVYPSMELFYRELMDDTFTQYVKVLKWFGLRASKATITKVLAETDLGAMKRMEMQRQLPGRNHPGRADEKVRKGGYGNFEEELSKETTAKCTEAMKLMLPENLLRMFDVLKSGQTWDGAARPNTLL